MSIERQIEELRSLLATIANIDLGANGDEHLHDEESSDLHMCVDCGVQALDLLDEIELKLKTGERYPESENSKLSDHDEKALETMSVLKAERDKLHEALAKMVYSYGLEDDEFAAYATREDLTNEEYDNYRSASLDHARAVLSQSKPDSN